MFSWRVGSPCPRFLIISILQPRRKRRLDSRKNLLIFSSRNKQLLLQSSVIGQGQFLSTATLLRGLEMELRGVRGLFPQVPCWWGHCHLLSWHKDSRKCAVTRADLATQSLTDKRLQTQDCAPRSLWGQGSGVLVGGTSPPEEQARTPFKEGSSGDPPRRPPPPLS